MPCDHEKTVPASSAKSFLRALVTSTLLLGAPLAVMAGNTNVPANFAGVYVARVAKTAPSMTVSLGADGTATVTGDLGKGSMSSFGSWQSDGRQTRRWSLPLAATRSTPSAGTTKPGATLSPR
jgi:hypothetical protein